MKKVDNSLAAWKSQKAASDSNPSIDGVLSKKSYKDKKLSVSSTCLP